MNLIIICLIVLILLGVGIILLFRRGKIAQEYMEEQFKKYMEEKEKEK